MNWKQGLGKAPRKKLLGVLAIATVAVGGWYWYSGVAQSQQESTLRPVPVTRGTVEEVVTAQGIPGWRPQAVIDEPMRDHAGQGQRC